MSNLQKVGASRKKNLLASIPIIIILILGFITLVPVIPVHAVTNTFTDKTSCGPSSACPNTNPMTFSVTLSTVGDVLVVGYFNPSGTTITGITDSLGNTFSKIASQSLTPTQYGASTWSCTSSDSTSDSEVWFAIVTYNGADTISISTSVTAGYCSNVDIAEGNSLSGAFVSATQSSAIGSPATATTSVNLQANQLIYMFGSEGRTSGGSSYSGSILGITQLANNVYGGTSGIITGYTYALGSSNLISGISVGSGNTIIAGVLTIVFSTSGQLPTIGAAQISVGCSGYTSGTFALTANVTYWFPFYITGLQENQYIMLQNISFWVSSISWGVSTHHHDIFAQMYLAPLYAQSNQLPSASATWPNTGSLYSLYNVANSATAEHISIYNPDNSVLFNQYAVPMASGYGVIGAIGLQADNSGVTLKTCSSSPTQYYNQTAPTGDYFVVTRLNSATPIASTLAFSTLIDTPQVTQTQTAVISTATVTSYITLSGTATAVQTVTVTLASLQGSQGAGAIVQNLVSYLPMWILPLILGAWFGLIGLFIGLILGVGLGTMFGLIPIWLAFLVGLGLLYMMSRLH